MLRPASSQCPRPGRQQIRIGTRAQRYSRGPRAPGPQEILRPGPARQRSDQLVDPGEAHVRGDHIVVAAGRDHVRLVVVFQPDPQRFRLPVGLATSTASTTRAGRTKPGSSTPRQRGQRSPASDGAEVLCTASISMPAPLPTTIPTDRGSSPASTGNRPSPQNVTVRGPDALSAARLTTAESPGPSPDRRLSVDRDRDSTPSSCCRRRARRTDDYKSGVR
jgi:hypothetical protein